MSRVSTREASVDFVEGRPHLALPPGSLVTYYTRIEAGSTIRLESLWERDAEGKRIPANFALELQRHIIRGNRNDFGPFDFLAYCNVLPVNKSGATTPFCQHSPDVQ